ncbi:bifunctional enoyl-CoA hydratase/phosphate acetyltransferase [candidate division KSB1 bacterium]|nr:bifunctional enoyl-CoA hydratase/phosphate acetyltransferase [candidate division KSB1 bacterium]
MIKDFDQLLEQARGGDAITVAIAAAADEAALAAVVDAQKQGFVKGVLFGDTAKIKTILKEMALAAKMKFDIRDMADDVQAAAAAVTCVRNGEAHILLKGKIKTANLLRAVLDAEKGLRSTHLLSDVFMFQDDSRPDNKLIMITDGGVTIKPDLKQKIEIIENAVAVAHALGNTNPRVAILSAIETVNPNIPSTQDAAILTKMNQRGQIKGCIIDGPLALDNAVSEEAARIKGIVSPVAGHADILVCPEIESGNMLAKSTTYWAKFRLGHVIMGTTAPVMIPSRSDSSDSKLLSMALGKLVCQSMKSTQMQ